MDALSAAVRARARARDGERGTAEAALFRACLPEAIGNLKSRVGGRPVRCGTED